MTTVVAISGDTFVLHKAGIVFVLQSRRKAGLLFLTTKNQGPIEQSLLETLYEENLCFLFFFVVFQETWRHSDASSDYFMTKAIEIRC